MGTFFPAPNARVVSFLYGVFLFSAVGLLSTLLSVAVSAQPKSVGPQDISRLHQQTEFSGDWSETDLFNLDKYVTVPVTIERLVIPGRAGNAYLLFSLKNPQKLSELHDYPSDHSLRATVQSVDVVKYLDINESDFRPGTDAVIRGWPAKKKNASGTVLLVDDVNMTGSGKIFSLHANNPKMEGKRVGKASLD